MNAPPYFPTMCLCFLYVRVAVLPRILLISEYSILLTQLYSSKYFTSNSLINKNTYSIN